MFEDAMRSAVLSPLIIAYMREQHAQVLKGDTRIRLAAHDAQ
jgi:hypothetical protein